MIKMMMMFNFHIAAVTLDTIGSTGRDVSRYDYSGRLGGSIDRDSITSSRSPAPSERPSFERSTTEYKCKLAL